MRFVRCLFFLCLAFASCVASAQSPSLAGTYRGHDGVSPFIVRAGADAKLDIVHLASGRSVSIAGLATAKGFTGILPGGDVVSLGDVFGRPHLLVGTRLLALTSISSAEFADVLAQARRSGSAAPAATHGDAGSLGGVKLVYAKSNNGYGQLRSFEFCSDGSFFYRFEELQSSQFGHAAGARTDSGRWTLDGTTLRLDFRSRGAASHTVQRRGGTTIALDNVVYAAERAQRCR